MNYLDELNPLQRQAVERANGPILIVAGPGTGKTKTLTARIVHLLQEYKVPSKQILALTFTKKAANEMRERVASQIGQVGMPLITTFHAMCYRILDEFYPENAEFITESQRLAIIKSLSKPTGLKGLTSRELGLIISQAKNSFEVHTAEVEKLVEAYNIELKAQNLRDFDDLLLQTHQLLSTDAGLLDAYKSKFTHILVDEFQDTNQLQYKLLRLLDSADDLFMIGDPKQSIYGFRGASGGIFEQFKSDFPSCNLIELDTNYRSSPQVVALSNAIFNNSPLKALKQKPEKSEPCKF